MTHKLIAARLVLSLSVLVVLAWLWSPQLVGLLVRSYLQELGLSTVIVRIESVSYDRLRIEQLSFARAAGNPQRVDLFGAELSFSLGELSGGHLRGLRIREAIVKTRVAHASPVFDIERALTLLVRPWQQDWPLKTLSVRKLTVYRAPNEPYQRFSLNLRHKQTGLVGRIGLQHAKERWRYVDLRLNRSGELRVMLNTVAKDAALPMVMDLSVKESANQWRMSGRVAANLQPLFQWLKPWLARSVPMIRGGHGEIEFSLTHGIASSQELRSRIALTSRLEALVVGTAAMHTQGEQGVAGLKHRSAQPVAAKGIHTVGLSAQARQTMLRLADASFEFEADVEQRAKGAEVVVGFRSEGQLRSLQTHALTVGAAAVHLPGTLWSHARLTELVLDPEATVMLEAFVYSSVRLPVVRITGPASRSNSQRLSVGELSQRIRISVSAHWQVIVPRLSAEQFRLQGEPVEVLLSTLAWSPANGIATVSGGITTPNLVLETTNMVVPCRHVRVDFVADGVALRAKFEVSLAAGAGRLHGELIQPFGSGRGGVTFALDALDFEGSRAALSHFLSEWPHAFDLIAGKLAFSGEFSWPQPTLGRGPSATTGTLRIRLRNGGGFYEAVWFSGIDTDIAFRLDPNLRTARSAHVKVNALDFGLPLRDVELTFALLRSEHGPLPRLVVYGLKAALLGGAIESQRFEFDANSVVHHMPLRLRQLDLAELVALYPFSGLRATGRLAGMMEVEMSQAGISVQDGMLRALAPGGRIHYRPEGSAAGVKVAVPGSGALFTALEDFRYEVLSAEADYAENGMLLLELHLEGKSPRLQPNRPIHVNFNLEQNVLSLLRSLRLVNGLNERLDSRVRAQYAKTKKRPQKGSRISP